MFLLVPAYPGCPGQTAVKWLLLVVGAGVVICLEQGADLHMVQLMPLPLTVFCFSKIQIGFTFLVLAYPGSLGQRAVKRLCVCVCSFVIDHSFAVWRFYLCLQITMVTMNKKATLKHADSYCHRCLLSVNRPARAVVF